MIIKCEHNSEDAIPTRLRKFAYTQSPQGLLDLTPGKEYRVYGVRKFNNEEFYLINTDTIHDYFPWWMPATLFLVVDSSIPLAWSTKVHGFWRKDVITASDLYHGNENAIEDGDESMWEVIAQIRKESN